jgi:CO/xanthine dehydrogenase FAD-binding subunit
MITQYHRPSTLDEALALLSQPATLPLAGGTVINTPAFQHSQPADFAVVDLQALGLDKIHKVGNNLEIDACVPLQQLLESPHCPAALQQAVRLEASLNIRNAASLAGTLVTCSGRSAFGTAMLALDARLTLAGGADPVARGLGDLFALRSDFIRGKLITKISIPLNARLAFETVARSPADLPIVCAAVAQWASGRTRLALGGWGPAPLLAMDGTEPGGIDTAARSAFHAAADEWASAEYRADVAATLATRCLEKAINQAGA